MYIFGSLSLNFISEIHPSQLIFKNKTIQGFHLYHTFLSNTKNFDKTLEDIAGNELRQDLKSNYLKTKINKVISMEEIEDSFTTYRSSMTNGKIIIDLLK